MLKVNVAKVRNLLWNGTKGVVASVPSLTMIANALMCAKVALRTNKHLNGNKASR